jgi:membrane protein implicated in regulation of membrane protease activity
MLENFNMLNIYFVFFGLGFFGLLSSLIFGDADDGDLDDGIDSGDTFDDNPKVFSLRVIFSFLMAFAIGGGSMYYAEKSDLLQILIGLVAGVLTGFVTWWITKQLYKFQGASNVNSDSFIGKSAEIVIPTSPESGKSKLRVSTINGPMELICKEQNNVKVKKGEIVKITGKVGTLLLVQKI